MKNISEHGMTSHCIPKLKAKRDFPKMNISSRAELEIFVFVLFLHILHQIIGVKCVENNDNFNRVQNNNAILICRQRF